MSYRSYLCFLFILLTKFTIAQQAPISNETKKPQKKIHGTFFVFWGYNHDSYTNSTITFKNTISDNYNFTIYNAKAVDRPNMVYWDHLNGITIPQYNFHLGYLFNDKQNLGIEVSWDHLKYVVVDNQDLLVKGEIRGHTIDKDTIVNPNFVHLQHTNGNNYLMANIIRKTSLYKKKHIEISMIPKAGMGPLMSYTISTILGNHDDGYFHYHGLVFGIGDDLRIDIFRYFFIQGSIQGAFADYTNTRLDADHKGLSTQTFFSFEYFGGFGFNIPLSKN